MTVAGQIALGYDKVIIRKKISLLPRFKNASSPVGTVPGTFRKFRGYCQIMQRYNDRLCAV